MRKIVLSVMCGITVLMADCNVYAAGKITNYNEDFQIWNTDETELGIGKATKFIAQQEFRWGKDVAELFYQHYDFGFSWAFDKAFELATGYRLILERIKYKWMESDEPYVMMTGKLDLWKFKFDDRNRIEYRHFRFAEDSLRYRNRFTIKYPIEFKSITISPFASNEIFIGSNATGYNQNRLESGLEFKLTRYIRTSVSYMQQQIKIRDDKWFKANTIWLKMKISY
jgi:hypothetical protein